MMKVKYLLIGLISLLLLSNCSNANVPSNTSSSSTNSNSISSYSSENTTSITNNQSSQTSSNVSSQTTSNTTSSQEVAWETNRYKLECGYYQMDLPKNYQSPYNLKTTLSQDNSSWSNNDLTSSLPTGFRYIYRNACDDGPKNHKTSANFYSNAAGGLKLDNTGVGFQTLMFSHTGEKLEIRIGISQVNNSLDTKQEGKDTFHIYFFDKNGNYLDKHKVEEGTISTSTKEIKFYYTNNAKDVAYFEFRVNAMPYKSSQCYNVGISYCNIKSWERA